MTSVHFDPFSRAAHADPYPLYQRLRDEAPVYHNPERGFWAVSRHEDVVAISRDWENYSVARGVDIDNAGDVLGSGFFLTRDPPVHTQYRNVVKNAFGTNIVRGRLEAPIRELAGELVKNLQAKKDVDLAMDLCWPVPARVMSMFLGFPMEDCAHLTKLGLEFTIRTIGTVPPPEISNNAGMGLMQYFQDIMAERRARPRNDLLSQIANAQVEGEPIGDGAEGMALLIFVGGFENVGCSLTNALYWLEKHPDQRAWLAANPDRIPQAIEEVLRYDSPQQNFKRTTTREVELHGVRIPEGKPVFLLYGSANRDERHYERAGEFDVRQDRGRHTSFGDGVHFCIGAPLARLEARIVLEAVLSTVPGYRFGAAPTLLASHAVRGFLHLPGHAG